MEKAEAFGYMRVSPLYSLNFRSITWILGKGLSIE